MDKVNESMKEKTLNKLLLLILLIFIQLQAQKLPTVAIMEFKSSGMSSTDAANITSRFGYELSKTNRFRITERQMMEEILNEQQFQLSGCTSSECVVEVGQLLSVEYMIAGEVSKTFDLYSLHVRIISVESGEVIAQVIEDYEGSARYFITGTVRNAALKLAAESSTVRSINSATQTLTTATRSGQIIFTLNISPVNVFIDGNFSGENLSSTVSLSLPMGDHTIKFTAEGYGDYEKVITIIPDEQISYSVELKKGTSGSETVVNTGIVVVRSQPEGAKVFLDGREIGDSPIQIPKVGTGKHTIKVIKNLYHDYNEQINVQSDGIVQVMALLSAAFGSLEINSTPEGAVVNINGQLKGRTPLNINELESGEYAISLTKDMYHPYSEKFIITDESKNKRDITLLPAFGQLNIKGNPNGTNVYLDSKLRGQTPLYLNVLSSGEYALKIEKELYETIEEHITIEDGKTYNREYALKPRFGILDISGTPAGAKVFVNNKTIGSIPINGYKVSAGLAEIKVEAENYHTKTKFQQINVGDLIPIVVNLDRHTGTIVVLTDPTGATVNLNDKNYDNSPKILKDMQTGLYDLAITHSDYLTVNREFSLALNERKEFNITLLTYEGSIQQNIDKRARYRNMNLIGSAAIAITAGALELLSQKVYADYEKATSTQDSNDLYRKANNFHKTAGYLGIVAGASISPALYWQIDIVKLARKLKGGNGK